MKSGILTGGDTFKVLATAENELESDLSQAVGRILLEITTDKRIRPSEQPKYIESVLEKLSFVSPWSIDWLRDGAPIESITYYEADHMQTAACTYLVWATFDAEMFVEDDGYAEDVQSVYVYMISH